MCNKAIPRKHYLKLLREKGRPAIATKNTWGQNQFKTFGNDNHDLKITVLNTVFPQGNNTYIRHAKPAALPTAIVSYTWRLATASGFPSVMTTSDALEQAATPNPARPDMPAPSSSTLAPASNGAAGLTKIGQEGRKGIDV